MGRAVMRLLRDRDASRDAAIAEALERADRAAAEAAAAQRMAQVLAADLDAARHDLRCVVAIIDRLRGAILSVA